ncbi:hypothetical protein F2Q69_00041845 [Brassica cretica]|uniref:Homeobox domain-containing protein n=1 Tax=Brassica cretica TaxID=69181 RepID=A0A8S9NHX9_BRACR|nr:hypothetical protein F2Q69_00041845 [Brassica cretica]
MGYISNNNLINYLAFSTTKPHLLSQFSLNSILVIVTFDFAGNIIDNDHHQHLINGSENNSAAAASSRWNPTPEQITALEEIYRKGTRTPTTEQIQQIASKLSKYGRIEGKNVFYWFQNHKSRERLKRRRCEGDNDINSVHEPLKDVKDSSSGGYRVDQTKIYASFPHTNQQPQNELVLPNLINNEDHCKTEESERASDAGKEAMCGNLVASFVNQEPGEINIEEDRYNVRGEVQEEEEEKTREIRTLNLFPVLENQEKTDWASDAGKEAMCGNLVASFVNQEPGEINIEEDRYNVRGEVQEEEEEKTREIRTLNLFPVLENQEKTDWFAEKKKANANRMCYNYRYYYEFMPLKKN